MKKYIFTFLLFLTMTMNAYSQQGWFWQNPLPQGNTIHGSHFLDQNTGYMCGSYGTILYTTNGGASIIRRNTNSADVLFSIYFINPNTGMAVGVSGVFLRTSNSGIDWIRSNILYNVDLNSIYFLDENTGFICGLNGIIGKTTNSGLNWVIPGVGTSALLRQVYFKDNLTGFVIGNNGVTLKTTNAGLNWNLSSIVSNDLLSICFLNSNTGFIMGSSVILKTTNAGTNWISVGNLFGTIYSLNKFDSANLFAAGVGKIYTSSNSGLNWILSNTGGSILFRSSSTLNENTAYVFGFGGTMLRTTNKGINWVDNEYGKRSQISSISIFDGNFGAASGNGSILTTTNSGVNWVRKIIDTSSFTNALYDIVLKNENEIYTVCQNRNVYKSTDFGSNWSSINLSTESLHRIKFLNQNTGYIAGDNIFYKTTNNGISWDSIYNSIFGMTDFVIQNSMNLYIVTSHGTVNKSTNSGTDFFEIASGYNAFRSICIINNLIFACGDYGFVVRSTNNGETWNSVFENEDLYNLNDIFFVDSLTGYFAGIDYQAHGLIYKTTNGGINWVSLYSGTSNALNSICFINSETGFAAGSWGTIIKTTNGGGSPIGIEPISNTIPGEYKLFQNYPNPFNPVTKINFSIPYNSGGVPVSIIVYDIAGREVKNFSYDNLDAGIYSIDFDGTNLASGVYFYQLTLPGFMETKKMVLLK